MKKLFILGTCLLLLLPAVASAASLDLGTQFNFISFDKYGNETYELSGGGSFDTSYLDGDELAWIYCVDLTTSVNLNQTYDTTTVSTTGEIYGATYPGVGQVAWLLDQYATSAQGNTEKALQAAIWTTIHGDDWDLNPNNNTYDPDGSVHTEYSNMLTALGNNTADVSNYLWISPEKSSNTTRYQGLVGVKVPGAVVPEPTTMMLFGIGLLGFAGITRKKTA